MLSFGLTIVRHGETQYNKDGLLQGQLIDSSLSDTGMSQGEACGRYLRDVKFTNVFVSDMLRARQTAEVIVKNNKSCSGMELVSDPLLKERGFGTAEGGRVVDMKNMAKAAGQIWYEFTPPNGETADQVKMRVRGFLKNMFRRVVDDHRDKAQQEGSGPAPADADGPLAGRADDGVPDMPVHALVVGHGAYIRVMVRYFIEDLQCSVPQDSDPRALCPNTGICRFILTLTCSDPNLPLSAMKCVFLNRCDHIKE